MGKRDVLPGNNLTVKPKKDRDFYGTIDPDAITPLLPHLNNITYAELCAGEGDLIMQLHKAGVQCGFASDIEFSAFLQTNGYWGDALDVTEESLYGIDLIITNPPFTWSILEPMINHFMSLRPTWLLLPADMMHNKRMGPYMKKCEKVVSVGRLCWFPDEVTGKMIKGTDNYVWGLFVDYETDTIFYGR